MAFRRLSIIISLCVGLTYHTVDIQASEPSIYSKMLTPSPLGRDRILVVCSLQNNNDQALDKFYNNVIWNEFSDRHLTLIEISDYSVVSVLGQGQSGVQKITSKARHHDYGDAVRKKASCTDDLQFVLIGKDTSVKARWKADFTQKDLFERIDAMPMRRFEMKQKADKN